MGKHSTATTRALRRSFWTSPALVAAGKFLDRLRGVQRRITAIALCALFVVVGSVNDFTTPLDVPCLTEDSVMCYWDGSTRGNGQGKTFIAITEEFRIYF